MILNSLGLTLSQSPHDTQRDWSSGSGHHPTWQLRELVFPGTFRDFHSAPSCWDQKADGHQQAVAKTEERWTHPYTGESSTTSRTVLLMDHYCYSGNPGLADIPLPRDHHGWARLGSHVRAISRRTQVFILLFFFLLRSIKITLLLT